MNSIIDKIRSKSRSGISASYKIINDFESSSEKECSKMDKENEKIYSKLLSQAEKAHYAIRNSGLSMNLEVPIPPRPSNRDRFLLWKKRNISKKVIEQTEAVLFLESKGYKYNEHYEAYQAIDLATEIRKSSGENLEFKDNSKNFDNVYNQHDKNIFRRRSMYKLKENEKRNFMNNDLLVNDLPTTQTSIDSNEFKDLNETTANANNIYTQTHNPSQNQNNSLRNIQNKFNQNKNQFITQNYSQLEMQNRSLNSVKPSAPPAQINQVYNSSAVMYNAPSAPPKSPVQIQSTFDEMNNQNICSSNNLRRNISSPCIGFGMNLEC
jgi:hypothetical protein